MSKKSVALKPAEENIEEIPSPYVKELAVKFRLRPKPKDGPVGLRADNPEAVWQMMKHLREEAQEVFCVLHLNAKNYVQSIQEITRGTLTSSLVEPAMVFRGALLAGSFSLILVHNHPSGNPEPSKEDLRLTKQLVECARLMDLRIHDHVVIGDERFVSLAARGIL
jgi:DNA repair protein RadC